MELANSLSETALDGSELREGAAQLLGQLKQLREVESQFEVRACERRSCGKQQDAACGGHCCSSSGRSPSACEYSLALTSGYFLCTRSARTG